MVYKWIRNNLLGCTSMNDMLKWEKNGKAVPKSSKNPSRATGFEKPPECIQGPAFIDQMLRKHEKRTLVINK